MTTTELLLALQLVQLTGLDDQLILINPEQVIELRTPRKAGAPGQGEHFGPGTNCLVFTSNGKYTPVIEDCAEVSRRLQHPKALVE